MHETFAELAKNALVPNKFIWSDLGLTSSSTTENSSRADEELSLLHNVCERISHSLRTPLGVGLGVIDDLENGIELSALDKQDGKKALEKISYTLDSFKPITSFQNFKPDQAPLNEVIEKISETGRSKYNLSSFDSDSQSKPRAVDADLLNNAVCSLLNYLNSSNAENISLSLLETNGNERLSIRCFSQELSNLLGEKNDKNWRNVAEIDKRVEAILLIYAHNVIKLHNGETKVVVQGDNISFIANLGGVDSEKS